MVKVTVVKFIEIAPLRRQAGYFASKNPKIQIDGSCMTVTEVEANMVVCDDDNKDADSAGSYYRLIRQVNNCQNPTLTQLQATSVDMP